jgi:TusA-related sulfurtransferase
MTIVTETLNTCAMTPMIAILKITSKMNAMKRGDILEVIGEYRHFEKDMKNICSKLQKRYTLITKNNNGSVKCRIYI